MLRSPVVWSAGANPTVPFRRSMLARATLAVSCKVTSSERVSEARAVKYTPTAPSRTVSPNTSA